jgi:hypothetical protein
VAADRDGGVSSEDSVFEFHVDVFAQIGAALGPAALPSSSAKDLAEPKEIAENIA